jgi:hypothetical protein
VTGYFLPGSSPSDPKAIPYKATIDARTFAVLNPRLSGRHYARQQSRGFREQLLDPQLFLSQHRRTVKAVNSQAGEAWDEKIVRAYRELLRPHIQQLFAKAFADEFREQARGNY